MSTFHRNKRSKTELQGQRHVVTPAQASGTSQEPSTAPNKQKKKPPPPPPMAVLPGDLPEDIAVWDNAVLLVDKPKGWTSFDVCGKLRGAVASLLHRKNREIKVGHAGTLDPMATGLLIICVGKATKSIDNFVAMQKEYSGVLRLGESTPSYDADTEVDERKPWEHLSTDALLKARDGLLGDIEQLPPMFSAIKVKGKRLYESARAGKEVERTARKISVERFDLDRDSESDQDVRFYVTCSKGTYVRSLTHDLGQAAGTAAHLTALRREAIGEFRVDNAWQVEDLVTKLRAQKIERKAEEESTAKSHEVAIKA